MTSQIGSTVSSASWFRLVKICRKPETGKGIKKANVIN